MALTWHEKHLATRTLGDRVADGVASFVGSWWFVLAHVLWFSIWIGFKVETFPYEFLTTAVSLEAIFLTTLIMMSQNREEQRDRSQAQADYDTNVKAKEEIEEMQGRLGRIEKLLGERH